jgi:hypothetical protein
MTPCNRSQYVQVIGDPQNPDQVIVVQRVERNVKHVSHIKDEKFDYREAERRAFRCRCASCKHQAPYKGNILQKINREKKEKDHTHGDWKTEKCHLCKEVCSDVEMWQCPKGFRWTACFPCIAHEYVQEKLRAKTFKHGFFEYFRLKDLDKIEVSTELEVVTDDPKLLESKTSAIVSLWKLCAE